MEIEGNEKADMKAKEAAIAEEKDGMKSTKIALKSARNASIKMQTKAKWTMMWNKGK